MNEKTNCLQVLCLKKKISEGEDKEENLRSRERFLREDYNELKQKFEVPVSAGKCLCANLFIIEHISAFSEFF